MDLRIENLTRAHPGGIHLRYPTLTAHNGLVALTGPNGSGKSTLLRMLATVLAPHDGDAWIGGVSLRRHGKALRHRIGWSPGGDGGFFPQDTALANLRLLCALLGKGPGAVDDAIAFCDATLSVRPLLTRRCGTLSTGQRARLQICRAILGFPALVLLDEPTRALDEESKLGCWAMLSTYGNRAIVVAATHDDEGRKAAPQQWELSP